MLPLGKTIGAGYASEPDKKLRFEKVTTVEGRLTRTLYVIPEGRSVLEVVRNYTNDLEGKGATTLFQCSKAECGEEFYKLQAFARALSCPSVNCLSAFLRWYPQQQLGTVEEQEVRVLRIPRLHGIV